jgi:phosphomannomutase/phosphoglucomutase
MSGHPFFAGCDCGFADALYAACRLMEIVAQSGHQLSYQLAELPKTVTTPEIRFDSPGEIEFDGAPLRRGTARDAIRPSMWMAST